MIDDLVHVQGPTYDVGKFFVVCVVTGKSFKRFRYGPDVP